jgi:hypothetical protein
MTARKNFKRLVRARARKTGESYAAAFRHLQKPGAEAQPMAFPQLRRIEKPEYGFALSLPDDWREEPADPFNSWAEVARFAGPGPGTRGCLVFRNATQPGIDAPTVARRVVRVLEQSGFGNFRHLDTVLAGRPGARLDFDKPAPSGVWSVRHYFVIERDTPFCVSFGTSALEQDAALIDTLAATFTFLEPKSGTSPNANGEGRPEGLPRPRPTLRIDPALLQRFKTYTSRAHRVLVVAHEEALQRNTAAIDQEHLVFGIASVPDSAGLTILARCGLAQEALQRAVETVLPPRSGSGGPPVAGGDQNGGSFRLTERADRTLTQAEDQARALGHAYVGVEHLVLALLRAAGPGYDLLAGLGVTLDKARTALAELQRYPGST